MDKVTEAAYQNPTANSVNYTNIETGDKSTDYATLDATFEW